MLNQAKIALAAALVLGGTSVALAGEGSPDLANSPAFSDSQSVATFAPAQGGGALDAYAQVGGRRDRIVLEQTVRAPSAAEKRWMDRESGDIDNN